MTASILETPRLIFRNWRLEDGACLDAIYGDAEVMKYITGKPRTSAENNSWLKAHLERQQNLEIQFWALCSKASGELIGHCGIQPCRLFRDDGTSLGGPGSKHLFGYESTGLSVEDPTVQIEVGFLLARSHWGQGFAQEAGSAAINFGLSSLGLRRMVGVAERDNRKSINALTKIGMVSSGEMSYRVGIYSGKVQVFEIQSALGSGVRLRHLGV